MATVNPAHPRQAGHTLAQTLVGMALSMLVLGAAFAVFAWLQNSHQQLQNQADVHWRLNTSLRLLRERLERGAAAGLAFDSKGMATLLPPPAEFQGGDHSLSVAQLRSLTPADCQGHQTTVLSWLTDNFMLNTRQELVCKDSARSNSNYQALVDGITGLQFRYAQVLPVKPLQMQWLNADQVSDWHAVIGVSSCVQVQTNAGMALGTSQPCAPTSKGWAWRGVAAMRHNRP